MHTTVTVRWVQHVLLEILHLQLSFDNFYLPKKKKKMRGYLYYMLSTNTLNMSSGQTTFFKITFLEAGITKTHKHQHYKKDTIFQAPGRILKSVTSLLSPVRSNHILTLISHKNSKLVEKLFSHFVVIEHV